LFQIVQAHNTSFIFVIRLFSQPKLISDKIRLELLVKSQRVEVVQSEKYKSAVVHGFKSILSQVLKLYDNKSPVLIEAPFTFIDEIAHEKSLIFAINTFS